jgi:hypothetical protein
MSHYRTSSQPSVYNYPEHLNPFYEDEQHKRLRFWKIKTNNSSSSNIKNNINKNDASSKNNKNKNNGDGTLLRRGSFNFGSLRDLL